MTQLPKALLRDAWDIADAAREEQRARMREAWIATAPTAGEVVVGALKAIPAAAAGATADLLEGAAVAAHRLGSVLPDVPLPFDAPRDNLRETRPYENTGAAALVHGIRSSVPDVAPNVRQSPWVKGTSTLGSTVPFAVSALSGAGLAGRAGALVGSGGAGVATQAGGAYDDAIRGGKDPATARTAAALSAPAGLLEVFPWARMGARATPFLARLLERTGPTLSKVIGTGAEETFLNEIPQTWWEEQVQYSIGNREEAMSLLEVAQEVGPTSFLAGAIFGGASAYLDRGNRAAARSTTTSTQKASNDPGAATPEPRTTSSDVVTGGAAPTFQEEQGAVGPGDPGAVVGATEDAGSAAPAAPDTPREAPSAPRSFDEPLREAVRRFAAQPEVALDREPDVFEAPAEIQERASRVGARVALVDLGEDAPADGFYDPETSTILVNARSPDPRSLLDHELVHFASAEYPDLYDQFRVAVEEVAPDVLARQSADRAKRQAAARGPDAPAISSAVLEEEALAELVQGIPKLLHLAETNPSAAVRIAQHSPGLFQRLADMVIDFAYRVGLTKDPSVRKLITDLELTLGGAETELGAQRGAFVALKVAELQRRMAGLSPLRAGRRLKTTKTPPPTPTEQAPTQPESPKNLAVDEAPVVAAMPKGRIIGTDLTGEPVYEKVERGDVARQGAGIEQPKVSQVGLFDEEGGLFEDQAAARDQGVATMTLPLEPTPAAAVATPSAPPAARPKPKAKLPLRMRESLQKRAAKTGSIRDWIAAHGGIAYDASLDDFTDRRQGKKRFGGPVVHSKGSSKGGHWDDVLRGLREAGFFPGKDTNELDINDLIDALETDRKHPDVAEDETERLAIQFESDRQEAEERALDEGAEAMFGRPFAELSEDQRAEVQFERDRRLSDASDTSFDLFSLVPRGEQARLDKALRRFERDGNGDALRNSVIDMRDRMAREAESRREKRDEKLSFDRARGKDWIVERLTRAKRLGELDAESVDLALWFVEQSPGVVDGLGVSVRSPRADRAFGYYSPAAKIVTLIKGADTGTVAAHEILHHTERMLPEDAQARIEQEWFNAITQRIATHRANGNEKLRALYKDMFLGAHGNEDARKRAYDAIAADSALAQEHYAFFNPSEYWAVHAAEMLRQRRGESWAQSAMRWLREFLDRLRSIVGLDSTHAVVRALNGVLAGQTQFVPRARMLSERLSQRRNLALPVTRRASSQASSPPADLSAPANQASAVGEAQAARSDANGRRIGGEPLPAARGRALAGAAGGLPSAARAQAGRLALPLDLKRRPEGPVQVGGPEETRIESVRRWVQDRFLRVRKLESGLGARGVSDAETLFHGRLQENLRQIELAGNEAAAILREHKISLEDAGRFLIARHQPRRDAVIVERGGPPNGSGMEPAVAAKIRADARKNPGFAKIAALNDRLTRETRERLVEFGLLSQEERDAWESIFGQTYTPLKTSIEPAEAVIRDPDPYQVKGPESERAEGRADEASNPLVQVLTDAAEVVYRAEVNRVYLQFLDLVDSKPAPWLWERSDRGGKGVLTMKVDGEPVHVRIHDPLALRAMQALRPDHVGGLLRFVSTVSRTYSAFHTSRNPEFVLSNLARDLQTAALNLSSEERVAFGARVVKGAARSLRAVWNVLRDPDAKGELEQYFREFRQDGGLTDWTGRPTFAQRQKDIEKRVARSGITQKMLDLWDFVEDANASVENAVRLSTYVEARRAGATRANAAVMAKEVTVNFSKKGEVGGALNALYLFFSARANGTVRLAQALRRHPQRAAAVAGSLVAAGFAMSALNRAFGGDDEEDGENWWSKQLAANKARAWMFQHPDGTTWRVPMVQGWGVFVVVGQMLEHAIFDDRITEGDAAAQAFLAGLDAVAPVTAGPSIAQTVSPWFLDYAIQLADNEDFAGRTIYPERFPNDLRPYAVIPDRFASPESRDLSNWLNESTGGDHTRRGKLDIPPSALDYLFSEAGGGVGRFVARGVEWFSKAATGEERAWRDVPIVNRFVGDAPNTYSRDFRAARESITQEAASKRGGARYDARLADLAPEMRRTERAVRDARDAGDDKRAERLMIDFLWRFRAARDARDERVGTANR